MAVYAKTSAITSNTELFIRRENNGSVIEFTGTTGVASRLPTGVLLAYGTATITGDQTIVVPIDPAINFVGVFSVQLHARGPIPPVGGDPNRYVTLLNITNLGIGNQINLRVYGGQRTTVGTPALTPFYYFIVGL
jgi:hypothetical protein